MTSVGRHRQRPAPFASCSARAFGVLLVLAGYPTSEPPTLVRARAQRSSDPVHRSARSSPSVASTTTRRCSWRASQRAGADDVRLRAITLEPTAIRCSSRALVEHRRTAEPSRHHSTRAFKAPCSQHSHAYPNRAPRCSRTPYTPPARLERELLLRAATRSYPTRRGHLPRATQTRRLPTQRTRPPPALESYHDESAKRSCHGHPEQRKRYHGEPRGGRGRHAERDIEFLGLSLRRARAPRPKAAHFAELSANARFAANRARACRGLSIGSHSITLVVLDRPP